MSIHEFRYRHFLWPSFVGHKHLWEGTRHPCLWQLGAPISTCQFRHGTPEIIKKKQLLSFDHRFDEKIKKGVKPATNASK